MSDNQLPVVAVVEDRIAESADIFTLRLRFADPRRQAEYSFLPGQFNMVYVFGVGEAPMSIASDPDEREHFDHTVRAVGRVTRGLAGLRPGDSLGIRGPFGRGWPLEQARDRDIVLITGGLGCAPLVSVIHYLMRRRGGYGSLYIVQGVPHADDLIWREQYESWNRQPDTQVLLAADHAGRDWPWRRGLVTDQLDLLDFHPKESIALLCGPEIMLLTAVAQLREWGLPDERIWLGLQRNMQCGDGLCGQCQIGPKFVCRDGPVFQYAEIADFFGARGF